MFIHWGGKLRVPLERILVHCWDLYVPSVKRSKIWWKDNKNNSLKE